MLYHHDSRNYNEAASEAAKRARAKLEKTIESGRSRAMSVIEQVNTQVPKDRVLSGQHLEFVPIGNGVEVAIEGEREHVHDHALGQLASRGRIPMTYVRHLQNEGDWGRELLTHNLNQIYREGPGANTRYLTRSYATSHGPELRGVLSDRYRRLDSRPLIEAFAAATGSVGALPIEGYALETKIALKAILPMVFEPVINEIVAFGVSLENSDVGDGAYCIRGNMLRLWCTNYAISDNAIRQVHLGGRINADFRLSQKTYDLDTEATASALNDVVVGLLSAPRVEEQCNIIRKAHEEEVSPTQVASYLKRHLNKGEAEQVSEAFASADIVNLPPGQTKWRMSNALSWVAGKMEDRRRGLEVMRMAGEVLS